MPFFKGWINPDFQEPLLIEKLSVCDRLIQDLDGQVFIDKRNRVGLVRIPLLEGKSLDVVIKEFRPRSLDCLKSMVFPSKAQKAWKGSIMLMEKGIPTPIPIAYLERKKIFPAKHSYYLTVIEEGGEEIRQLFRNLAEGELEWLLQSLARHLFFCHQQGILHRDLSDGNILVKKSSDGKYTFSIVDTNRIRTKKRIGLYRRIKNLIRLGIPRIYQPFFLRQYTETERLKKSVWYWYRINKKAYTRYTNLKRRLFFKKK